MISRSGQLVCVGDLVEVSFNEDNYPALVLSVYGTEAEVLMDRPTWVIRPGQDGIGVMAIFAVSCVVARRNLK